MIHLVPTASTRIPQDMLMNMITESDRGRNCCSQPPSQPAESKLNITECDNCSVLLSPTYTVPECLQYPSHHGHHAARLQGYSPLSGGVVGCICEAGDDDGPQAPADTPHLLYSYSGRQWQERGGGRDGEGWRWWSQGEGETQRRRT